MYLCYAVIVFVCICGARSANDSAPKNYQKPHPVVMGGYVAKIEEFPYALRVYISQGRLLIFCTAEAVHRRLVLTAAHCVVHRGSAIVVTGNADHDDYVNARNLHKYARYKIVEIFVHPEFSKVHYQNDVALLKTGRDMLHQGHALIPISYDVLKGTVSATIFGWGGTEFSSKNNQLYGKQVSVRNCSLKPHSISYRYVCLLEKGICHGDSGGGMIYNNAIVGVASFYQRNSLVMCGSGDLYYYAAMSEVKEFMERIIGKNGGGGAERVPRWCFVAGLLFLRLLLE